MSISRPVEVLHILSPCNLAGPSLQTWILKAVDFATSAREALELDDGCISALFCSGIAQVAQVIPSYYIEEGYLFLFFFFAAGFWIFLWVPGSMLSCFSDFLLFCSSAYPASLLSCFSAFPVSLLFLLLCFSAFCFSFFFAVLLLCFPCFSTFVLLCFSTSTILLFLFFSHVFLLLYFLLLCFFVSCLYSLYVFYFLLLYSVLFVS